MKILNLRQRFETPNHPDRLRTQEKRFEGVIILKIGTINTIDKK
jgi:hypothetical protein